MWILNGPLEARVIYLGNPLTRSLGIKLPSMIGTLNDIFLTFKSSFRQRCLMIHTHNRDQFVRTKQEDAGGSRNSGYYLLFVTLRLKQTITYHPVRARVIEDDPVATIVLVTNILGTQEMERGWTVRIKMVNSRQRNPCPRKVGRRILRFQQDLIQLDAIGVGRCRSFLYGGWG